MTIAILSYDTSILNPFLKLLIFALFVLAAWFFYRSSKTYGGILSQISTFLCIGAGVGALAALFRFQGDFYTQFKWGESIFDLVMVIICLAIALLIRAKMLEVTRLFEDDNGGKGP
jgi:hypothetical protein